MNRIDTDLIVVGAGILGLSAAIQAAEQGLRVCLFEKDPHAIGATRRNFGMVGISTLTRPDTKWRQYALETCQFYQRIQNQQDISFQQRDGVYLANTELEWQVLHEFSQVAPDYAIAVTLLNQQQLRQRCPYLNVNAGIRGGLLFHADYSVEPELITDRLLDYAQQLGVKIYHNACVIQTRSEQGKAVIQLASGQCYTAAKIFICHGEISQILYPEVLKKLGLLRCSLQMMLTEPLRYSLHASLYSGLSISRYPAFEICPSHSALIAESQQGVVKDYGLHILVKQNQYGQLILGDSHEYRTLDQAKQFNQREEINQFIWQYCQQKMGLMLPKITSRWNGYYLTHPDHLASVIEVEPHIFLISAIAGKGMTTGAGFMKEILETYIL